MNRLRAHKFKLNTDITSNQNNNNNITNNNNNNNESSLFTKITKRYSTLSSKITRRHLPGRKSVSPQKAVSGSYDLQGSQSDDHKLEIGAPILISTTTIDTERLDVSEARLRQIGGGIARTNENVQTLRTVEGEIGTGQSSPTQAPSSESENEVFVDALDVTPRIDDNSSSREHFENAFDKEIDKIEKDFKPISEIPVSEKVSTPVNPLQNYYEAPKIVPFKPNPIKLRKPKHSRSAQNLHRSELKVFLQKAPSMELNKSLTTANFENCQDLPNLPELFGASKCSIAASDTEDEIQSPFPHADDDDENKENLTSSNIMVTSLTKSEPFSPTEPELNGYINDKILLNKSIDSVNFHHNLNNKRLAIYSSNVSLTQQNGSKQSLNSQISHTSTITDFDLKSVSCHSLNAQSLFVSIDELNDLTRQINESEDFDQEIDLEYCQHRDNLKPSERRITLLKNKNTRLISFNNNKEKLKKGWTGVKHWVGEESSRLKDVMHKPGPLQRFASSKLNISHSDNRQSPSINGIRSLNHESRSISRDLGSRECETLANSTFYIANGVAGSPISEVNQSCDNIANEDFNNSNGLDPTDGDEMSPKSKRTREEGQNGFEELRRFIKQGGDFGKELILILQERVDSELLYSKSLSKMANKLNKACRELPGSIADAWRGVATEMETRSDIHRQLSLSLTDEIVKPLKSIIESHHKSRKSVESNVDKASRVLSEWRVSEAKAKKSSHTAARENEKLQDAMLDVRIQKSPSLALLQQGPNKVTAEKEIKSAEKDCAKLDQKRKKAEEAVKRADVEYYTLCIRAERARVDWEMAVLRGSSLLQSLENQRLINMKNFVSSYARLTANMNPILDTLVQRMQPQIDACNVVKDMQIVKNIRRNAEGPSEQLLPDFYCEHTTLAMNRERRKHALIKLLQLVKTDLERERRSRNGLKNLSQSLNSQENQNITDKLYHIRSMLTYLEGARFKLHSALLELDHKPRSQHPLAQHIQITRDRTGLQQSILKVPLWLKNNDKLNMTSSTDESVRENDYDVISQANTSSNVSVLNENNNKDILLKSFSRSKSNIETFSSSQISISQNNKVKTMTSNLNDPYYDRGQADGGSNQQDSDFDEFSSQDEDDEQSNATTTATGQGSIQTNSNSHARKEHKVLIEKATNIANQSNDCNDHHYQNTKEIIQKEESGAHHPYMQYNNTNNNSNNSAVILSRCKALYSYTPKLYDELELSPGDIIEVHAKQEDGWWLGALRNQVGIFPATYVEEFA